MSVFMDLTGKKFGRLTVKCRAPNIGSFVAWFCQCRCGNTSVVLAGHLRQGRIISCGCYKQENSKRRATKHGDCGSKLHRIWLAMRQRCLNPKSKSFKDYGGRGICVCADWDEYSNFKAWALAHGYKEGLSIERIGVNGNYCPENCTWIPKGDQNKNTRRTLNNRKD